MIFYDTADYPFQFSFYVYIDENILKRIEFC